MRWVLLLCLLTGCGQAHRFNADLSHPYNLPPLGSQVVLKRPMTIKPGTTRLFLQQGEPMALSEFDRYKPNCNFEVRDLSSVEQVIEPDSFSVIKVERLMTEVVRQKDVVTGLLPAGMDDQGTSMVARGIHLWFDSVRKNEVMRLTCRGAFADMWEAQPPSIEEIRAALGEYAELVVAI
ncbi:MAG: hypothetical protein KZQ99_23015 [Candidatus Thiodiazotropha sp. (ex Dulcina madagascariensis)]|nr:hypothetical protein [Candidatus Thiodiazotropha sp. (ex Dulcina madagascariensis)]